MINIADKKKLMQETLAQLGEILEDPEHLVIMRMKYLTMFGDFSNLPDEVEDSETGQTLLKYIDNKIKIIQWLVRFGQDYGGLLADYSKKFKAGTIPKAELDKELEEKMDQFISKAIPGSENK